MNSQRKATDSTRDVLLCLFVAGRRACISTVTKLARLTGTWQALPLSDDVRMMTTSQLPEPDRRDTETMLIETNIYTTRSTRPGRFTGQPTAGFILIKRA
jgi:hypothetical protein